MIDKLSRKQKFALMAACCVVYLLTMTFRYTLTEKPWNVITAIIAGVSLISALLLSINLAFRKDDRK